jgi:hypothetical protein
VSSAHSFLESPLIGFFLNDQSMAVGSTSGSERDPLRAPSRPAPFLPRKEPDGMSVRQGNIRPLPPQDPRSSYLILTGPPVVGLRPIDAPGEDEISKSKTAIGRLDPENSQGTVRLDD